MKQNIKLSLILLGIGLIPKSFIFAQTNPIGNPIKLHLVEIEAGLNQPTKDLAQRFGYFTSVGPKYTYKTKTNWNISLASSYLFGNQIKNEDPISLLRSSSSDLINEGGTLSKVNIFLNGFQFNLGFGKTLPLFGPNKNSGLHLETSLGYMTYNYRFKVNDGSIQMLTGEYKKGFDKLTGGVLWGNSVSYLHLSNNSRVNYKIGIFYNIGFNKSQRSYFYNDNKSGNVNRNDQFIGLKLSWILPLYKRSENDFLFY